MTLVSDEQGRLIGNGLLRPNASYEAAVEPDGSIRLTVEPPADVPVVHPRRVDGQLVGAELSLDRARVAAAIRNGRDAR